MMAQVEQFSSFPHAASRALSLLLENTEMVALKEPTTVVSQVQRFHVALAERVSSGAGTGRSGVLGNGTLTLRALCTNSSGLAKSDG